MDSLTLIGKERIIAILRKIPKGQIIPVIAALSAGGIQCVEITFDQAAPLEATTDALHAVRRAFPSLHLGAGTVMTIQQVQAAYAVGAQFIISPNTNADVICETKRLGMVSMPGAMTPTEIAAAAEAGADIVKLFPSDTLGIPYFKAVRAPLHHIRLAAVGGVNLSNLQDFLACGAYCVGIGANISDPNAIARCDYDAITKVASQYMACARNASIPT